jgi:hypothetical protein
LLYIMA